MGVHELWGKLKSFLLQTKRVLQVTRKPTMLEFKTIAKVTGLGIALIGLVGFLLQMIHYYITG